ncbi:MAG: type II secretion system protein [Planctomycetota bacterium]|nr:type II secretion system protein [Planctomycetota bacterium]
MKKKGFTLVELLVVIAIIALLMGILMPALNRVRQIAYRMICGTHLKGIGNAMILYANDSREAYPVAGPAGRTWSTTGRIALFDAMGMTAQADAFGAGDPTVTSSLFMLVKGYDVTPSQFNCKGDVGIKEFKLSDTGTSVTDLAFIWDFGGGNGTDYSKPGQYNSYAYQLPYSSYPMSSVSASGSPVCSDRNPYLDKNAYGNPSGAKGYLNAGDGAADVVAPSWDTTKNEYKDPDKTGNCAAHQREGQNVLYNDNHVGFEKFPNVGVQSDHIWKYWPSTTVPTQQILQLGTGDFTETANGLDGSNATQTPQNEQDAYLVSERNIL